MEDYYFLIYLIHPFNPNAMYNNDIRNRFIEHRARGISLDKVTSLLGICRTTAVEWNRKYKTRVADLRALQYEAVLQRAGADYEREVHLAMAQLNRIREVLARRKVEHLSTEYLYNLEAMAFARMEKLMRLAELPDHGRPAEASEPAEPELDVPTPSPNVDASEGDDPVRLPQFVPDLFNRSAEAQNRPVSGPFPTQKEGGGASEILDHDHNLNPALNPTSAPPRLCVEASETKSNETERFAKSDATQPRNINDLQRPPSESSRDGARPSPVAATPDQPAVAQSADTETASVIDSSLDIRHSSLAAGGESQDDGDSPVVPPLNNSAPAQPIPHPVEVPSSDVPAEMSEGESIVVNPHECPPFWRSVLQPKPPQNAGGRSSATPDFRSCKMTRSQS
jgi:transposase